jgi:prevent-host-death family protein
MEEAVSAADANRSFSRILRSVREGHSVVVTSHGKPVAKIVPVGEHDERTAEAAPRLRSEPVIEVDRWTRDELYEADP